MPIDSDETFYTATMARLHTDQGRYEEAAKIYRYLLEKEPERIDLQTDLNAVLEKQQQAKMNWEDVRPTVEQWVGLVLGLDALGRLRKTKSEMIGPDSDER
jgi:hypothetical protein